MASLRGDLFRDWRGGGGRGGKHVTISAHDSCRENVVQGELMFTWHDCGIDIVFSSRIPWPHLAVHNREE